MSKTTSGLSLAVLKQRDPIQPVEQPRFIAALDRALVALREATDVRDVADMRDWARAAEAYAHAVDLGDEAERYARETRIRAARKAGELLRHMRDSGARRRGEGEGKKSEFLGGTPTLADLGIGKKQAMRWQRMALVATDVFEAAVRNGEEETAIARRANRPVRVRPVQTNHGKRNGPTERQSLAGLQQAAISLQALAENLDGDLFGDWSLLSDVEEAQQWFDILAESLPVVNARVRRALRDRREHGH